VRIAVVIVSVAAVAVALVNIRRMEMAARHETLKLLKVRDIELGRRSYDQDIDLGYLAAPAEVNRRRSEMRLEMAGKQEAQFCRVAARAARRNRSEP
jgi:hypothetical protein